MSNDDKETKALAGAAVGLGVINLIAILRGRAKAAAPTEIPAETLTFYQDVRDALAAILEEQILTQGTIDNIGNKVDNVNSTLRQILSALGVTPPGMVEQTLEPFEETNQTLQKGTPFGVYETKVVGQGSLIWAIFDVSDPSVKVSFRFDNLLWEFRIDTLYKQGIQQPLFPGVWLTKYDAVNSRYVLIFSAGNLKGFSYEKRLIITVLYDGSAASATLNEARGIKWTAA